MDAPLGILAQPIPLCQAYGFPDSLSGVASGGPQAKATGLGGRVGWGGVRWGEGLHPHRDKSRWFKDLGSERSLLCVCLQCLSG